ncbi:hypothetical protein V6N12_038581 [Hibiscus sabdariffa]
MELWCQMNLRVFDGQIEEWGSVLTKSKWLASIPTVAWGVLRQQTTRTTATMLPQMGIIDWSPPVEGWIKLNVDGARSKLDGKASWRALRYHNDIWDSVDALKAIKQGVKDSGLIAFTSYIKEICYRDWSISFVHVTRRNNGVVVFAEPLTKVLPMLTFDDSG